MSSVIHISREGQPLGQFEPEQMIESFSLGVLRGSDLAWREGEQEWQPLESFISQHYPEGTATSEEISEEAQTREEDSIDDSVNGSEITQVQEEEAPASEESDVSSDAVSEPPAWGKSTQLLPKMPRTDKNAFAEEKKTILWIGVIFVAMLFVVGTAYFIFS